MKRSLLAAVVAAAALGMTGCTPYTGINSLPLPGTVGTGSDSYEIKVQLHNADDLVANTPVFVDDINVGTTTLVALDGWTPTLTLSLSKEVRLPANATAALAQTSLLGSKHIDLIRPANAKGTLVPGSVIKEDAVHQFPETEDLLAGVSVLLNGGGLQHVQTITSELNRALGNGRDVQAKELLTQFDNFTTGLDKQTSDITAALHSFDRLGKNFSPRMDDIDKAISELPKGLDTLDDLEPQLKDTLHSLGEGAESIAPFADDGSDQLKNVLHDLKSPFKQVGDVQEGTPVRALRLLPFVIFNVDAIPYLVRGDYANLVIPVNLTLDSLDSATLTGTPASGLLHGVAQGARDASGSSAAKSLPKLPSTVGGAPLTGTSNNTPNHSGSGPLNGLPSLGN